MIPDLELLTRKLQAAADNPPRLATKGVQVGRPRMSARDSRGRARVPMMAASKVRETAAAELLNTARATLVAQAKAMFK